MSVRLAWKIQALGYASGGKTPAPRQELVPGMICFQAKPYEMGPTKGNLHARKRDQAGRFEEHLEGGFCVMRIGSGCGVAFTKLRLARSASRMDM